LFVSEQSRQGREAIEYEVGRQVAVDDVGVGYSATRYTEIISKETEQNIKDDDHINHKFLVFAPSVVLLRQSESDVVRHVEKADNVE
jgi:hypothetical protein